MPMDFHFKSGDVTGIAAFSAESLRHTIVVIKRGTVTAVLLFLDQNWKKNETWYSILKQQHSYKPKIKY